MRRNKKELVEILLPGIKWGYEGRFVLKIFGA
jgi:hypothetical protein